MENLMENMTVKKVKLPKEIGKAYVIDGALSYGEIRSIYSGSLAGEYTFTQQSEGLSNIANTRLARHIGNGDSELGEHFAILLDRVMNKFKEEHKFDTALMASEIYINMSDAMTTTLPHTDRPKGCWTLLYYANYEWDIKYGGQTNFLDDNMEILAAVIPKPGRFILFEANILHQATPPTFYCPFKRLTIASKLDPIEDFPENEYNEIKDEYVATNTCWN